MKLKSIIGSVVQVIIVSAIIFAAWTYYSHLMDTSPKNKIKPRVERATPVKCEALKQSTEQIYIYTSGKVIPERQLSIKPRITGEITKIHTMLHPGGHINKGEVIAEIDPTDYEIALTQAQSKVKEAEFQYQLELGEQDVAKYEWNFLEDKDKISELEKQLILRIPHLEKAKSDIAAAKAQLKQAEINLSRTKILAPFNVQVIERNVTEGSQVNLQSSIAELIDSDNFWVEASIRYERLPWIQSRNINSPGAEAEIIPSSIVSKGFVWKGNVLRMLPNISENARRARLLIEVKSPLNQQETPLLLNTYVRIKIAGPEVQNIFKIPANVIHEGNKIYIYGQDERLEIRELDILWSDNSYAYIKDGLNEGELLISTTLDSAVPGLKLTRILSDK
ncbi:efflux RND transporter periplasmic adaptor subunit [Lentisphaera marina]|uniref:efflux RND transporter periplasmic adaptor subunit n=1 Tax=Lentisphaera marina TaxID=1111041 RepID=UPI0023666BA3|nr:efflux RND transporter periplasmic adaptor subunit [Lentisphaera marina]MDD7986788.1 efflux RND transporter periplasmic adaptor subunit [Lentisphaera marina]